LCKHVRYTKSCISREMAYVATGWFDVAINVGGNYYDNAPIKLIVEEAGGTVTTLSGGEFGHDDTSMIVSNGIVHQEVLHILK
jgi:fructose-1,6-bisphosphatase/inositol monophosphatase family enzyme